MSESSQGPTVLLADGDPVCRRGTREALSRAGYRVLAAEDGERALAILEERSVDVVVGDIAMPRLDGVELLIRCAAIRPHALRILIGAGGTGNHAGLVRAINEAHVHGFFPKPLDLESFRERLDGLHAERQSVVQAERLAAVGELVGGVAHELNNPLTAVVGFTELIMLDVQDEALRRDLDKVLTAARRASQIVRNLVAFVRPSGSGREVIDLDALIKGVANVRRHELRDRDISLRLSLEATAPRCWGDPLALRQLLLNLLANAEAGCRARGGERRIELTTAASGRRTLLRIMDDGEGIAPEHLGRVFEPFFTTRSDRPGRGLGLSVVHGIVSAHGGEIRIESTRGEGTVVQVWLPLGEGAVAGAGAEQWDGAVAQPLEGRSVLVVDDEASVRDYLVRLLERLGMEARAYASAEETLQALESGPVPDAVLCDIRMPGIGGPGLYRSLERSRPELLERIVFITGDALGRDASEFLAAVRCPTLEKPLSAGSLAAALTDLIGPGSDRQRAGASGTPPAG